MPESDSVRGTGGRPVRSPSAGRGLGLVDLIGGQVGPEDGLRICLEIEATRVILVDGRSDEREQLPWPTAEAAVLIVDIGPPAADLRPMIAARRSECLEAARALGRQSLRDVDATLWLRWHDELPELLHCRANHIRSENDRVAACAEAIALRNWQRVGDLVNESQASLIQDFELVCPEVEALRTAVASQPGVLGSRISAEPFCRRVVAVVEPARLVTVAEAAVDRYRQAAGRRADWLRWPSAGMAE